MHFGTVWMVLLPKKSAQKVIVLLFPYLTYITTKWNIVYVNLETKIFLRDANILPQMQWASFFFVPSVTTIEGFWISLNYPILNFKKTVYPNIVWMCHWKITLNFSQRSCNLNYLHSVQPTFIKGDRIIQNLEKVDDWKDLVKVLRF